MARELLNILEAIADRPYISIGGKPYPLRLMDEFGIRDRVALRLGMAAFSKAAGPDLTLEEAGAADEALAGILALVFLDPLPGDVAAALTRAQKEMILAAFFGEMERRTREREPGAAEEAEAESPTSA
ncbi:MAG: hypothetical protein AAB368_03465 [bacterium]